MAQARTSTCLAFMVVLLGLATFCYMSPRELAASAQAHGGIVGELARHHVVGLLRDRARDPPTGGHDALGGLLARPVRQAARQHERLARERALGGWWPLFAEAQPQLAQFRDQRTHALVI